jgi:tetratricopeptide (TPR) repeat protein
MPLLAAERRFNEGLAALADSRHAEAANCFRDAMKIEETRNAGRRDMRYLSYYGLSISRAGGASAAGVKACQDAVTQEPHRPAFLLNLGRAHLVRGETDRALDCFRRGAALAPAHGPLRRELGRLTRLTRPGGRSRKNQRLAIRWVDQIRSRFGRHMPRWLSVSRGRAAL